MYLPNVGGADSVDRPLAIQLILLKQLMSGVPARTSRHSGHEKKP
jgi:hypothetical protein